MEKVKCDLCGAPAVYDGRISMGFLSGSWAYMCEDCFQKNGIGLGLGKGQKLK